MLYLVPHLARGGAEGQLVELTKNIDQQKYHPIILLYDIKRKSNYKQDLDERRVKIILIKRRFKLDPFFLGCLVRFITREKFDIVHCYMQNANFWGRIAGKLAGCKVIIASVRNTNLKRWVGIAERILSKIGTIIIANSHAIKSGLVNVHKVTAAKIEVIYNGVDCDKFKPIEGEQIKNKRKELGLKDNDFMIALVGKFHRQKNHICLLKALLVLKDEGKLTHQVKVLFIGPTLDSNYKRQLEEYISLNRLNDYVIFSPPVEDIEVVMNAMDVLVLPSLWEGFPNVILEAMAVGKPVISSDIANNFLLVNNNGLLFPKNDHEELSRMISNILNMSEEERKKMGNLGRKVVVEKFSVANMVNNTQSLYDELLRNYNTIGDKSVCEQSQELT